MASRFEPKVPVQLNPPKDDPISKDELAKANGMSLHLGCASLNLQRLLMDNSIYCIRLALELSRRMST